jgi:subtilisin family serine protease
MATPVVAGVAARVWGLHPGYTAAQVRARIQDTADPAQGFPRAIKRVNLYRALGGANLTFQGSVLDSVTVAPLAGAVVTVTANGVRVCSATTSTAGFYTCGKLPAAGIYQVRTARSGRIATTRSFQVNGSRFNANLAMTRPLGTSTSGDWTATILWNGWQPFESKGLEADIWLVDPGVTPC